MSHENEHDRLGPAEQRQIERRLAALSPAPVQVDRDRLMFLAGQANVLSPAVHGRERRVDAAAKREAAWLWPAATAMLGATSLALLVALISRAEPPPQIVYRDRVIRVAAQPQQQSLPTPRPAQASAVPITLAVHQRQAVAVVPADNYVRTREVALRMGLDAIGSPRSSDGDGLPSTSYGDWLQSLADDSGDKQRGSGMSQLPNM